MKNVTKVHNSSGLDLEPLQLSCSDLDSTRLQVYAFVISVTEGGSTSPLKCLGFEFTEPLMSVRKSERLLKAYPSTEQEACAEFQTASFPRPSIVKMNHRNGYTLRNGPPLPARGRGVQQAVVSSSGAPIEYDNGRQAERPGPPGQSQSLFSRATAMVFSSQTLQSGQQYSDHDTYEYSEQESTREKMERYRRQRNEAEDQIVILQGKLSTLETEVTKQQEAVFQTKESATRVRVAMQDKELFIGPQALDRTIQTQFNTLFKNVRTWSRYLGGAGGGTDAIDLSTIDPAVRKQFELIAPGSDELGLGKILARKSRRRYFFQGWIGLVIVENFLPTLPEARYPGNSAHDLWLDSQKAKNLWDLERALFTAVVTARDFNDWRAYSASLLLKTNASDELPESTVEILWQRCREAVSTISRWTSGEQEQEQDMSSELLNIFTEAVQLSKILRVQRAQWSIRFPFVDSSTQQELQGGPLLGVGQNEQARRGLMFDRNTMKSVEPHDEDEPTDNKKVEVFISPGLFKRGDADGEKFDVFSIIEPSSVMWTEAMETPLRRSAAVQTIERRGLQQLHLGPNAEQPQPRPDAQQKAQVESAVADDGHDSEDAPLGSDPMEVEQTHHDRPKQELMEDSSSRRQPNSKPKKSGNVVKDLVTKISGSRVDKHYH